MKDLANEKVVAQAFSNQSGIFDELYDSNYLVHYSRTIIRAELVRNLKADDRILELNAGTGTDAIFLAQQGYHVTATDISPGMIQKLNMKVALHGLTDSIDTACYSFWEIDQRNLGMFDFVYSNFGGLNCTQHLDELLPRIFTKLKPGGMAVLVVMPVFCLWERIMLLKGNVKQALRRKNGKPASAHIEGEYFKVWYHNPSTIEKALNGVAMLTRVQSLSLFVPPSAHRHFPHRFPTLLKWLEKLDAFFTTRWPFRNWGDYVILTFEKLQ